MEFSWSTFVLEIINFLVLVWILKHFLFKPVMAVITQRQDGIDEQLAESQRLNDESAALKEEYENRLANWQEQCQLAREELNKEIDAERTSRLELLTQSIEKEKKKAEVAESRQRVEVIREKEHQALQQSARFAKTLLSKASGPDLESRLLNILLDDLSSLSHDHAANLLLHWGVSPEVIEISSAYPIPENKRQELEEALAAVSQLSIPVQYDEDPELIAGLCITIGAWCLRANIRDDLKGFMEFAYVTR
ncbi:Component of the F(0) channel [Vibrio sp. B1FLJ16]|uniref:F0F1 ATP synthase subunit delta n=1 Tax=Vibrio sp. B1FLJ16 TaxID=2751178 RepID=UPI0015F55822|nr:F0F1 ATP synthase subunit delta [Vibrio sp. B1FLJ16]CAD7820015.1 Component of the F(0) channel [Vibrio sp. B1FLJ16]CAE6941452.1 Component of the F(0) channel [Vibrio sp. B1FLJ16]